MVITHEETHGLAAVILESSLIRVKVLLQGCKIIELYNKKTHKNWLWSNPKIRIQAYKNLGFDAQWFGGMDDIFPNDETVSGEELLYPDHGFLWNQQWELVDEQQLAGKGILFRAEYNGFIAEKRMSFLDENELQISYKFYNNSPQNLDYIFRIHPAFSFGRDYKLHVNASSLIADECWNEPKTTGHTFQWPQYGTEKGMVDLSALQNCFEEQTLFCYAALSNGSIVIEDTATTDTLSMTFDGELLPYLTIFGQSQKFDDASMIVLEPSTGPYADLKKTKKAGFLQTLHKDSCVEFAFTVQLSNAQAIPI